MSSTTYRIAGMGTAVGMGISNSRYLNIASVGKMNSDDVPYCLANEYICSQIGRFLYLPIPPGIIVHSPSAPVTKWFASLNFNQEGATLPPIIDPEDYVQQFPKLSVGLLLFDILVANADRHAGNLAVDTSRKPPTPYVFDHGHALFGDKPGDGVIRIKELRDRIGISGGTVTGLNRHCLIDFLPSDDYFVEWFLRIESIPDFFIKEVCHEALHIGTGITKSEAEEAITFLMYRRRMMREIIRNHRAEFLSIMQWDLWTLVPWSPK